MSYNIRTLQSLAIDYHEGHIRPKRGHITKPPEGHITEL